MKRLAALTDNDIAKRDVAEWNLSVAEGLPGSEGLDVRQLLAKLVDWAAQVAAMTKRNLPRFHRNPAEYENSEAQFRICAMVTVLQRDLGVRYNADLMDGPFNASDSRTHFIHGPLTGFGGTCVNLPILYVAVGQRLGYPLKLAFAKEHCFVRWVGADGERFNIEATSLGFCSHGDEHYHHSPRPLSAKELASGRFLRDLTPRQELASYLCSRGYVTLDNLLLTDCLEAFATAAKLDDRYEGDWATAILLNRILNNLSSRVAENEEQLRAEIERVTPRPIETWERYATPIAQDHLQRIIWRLACTERAKQNRIAEPTTFACIA